MRTLVLGDLHGMWWQLKGLIDVLKPDLVLQCGDFDYTPTEPPMSPQAIQMELGELPCDVRFCDGNHDDWRALRRLAYGLPPGEDHRLYPFPYPMEHEIVPRVFYQERGSTLVLPDGRTVLFIGGAMSVIDRSVRSPGVDLFDEEVISPWDMDRLPKVPVDIVISHTTPRRFRFKVKRAPGYFIEYNSPDPSQDYLDEVFDRYRPKLWYAGHWHENRQGETDGCRWRILDMVNEPGGWAWLED
jgi:hypothetical protein